MDKVQEDSLEEQIEILKKDKELLQKEFDFFMNEQFRILQGHFSKCMLRCFNKYMELFIPKEKTNDSH